MNTNRLKVEDVLLVIFSWLPVQFVSCGTNHPFRTRVRTADLRLDVGTTVWETVVRPRWRELNENNQINSDASTEITQLIPQLIVVLIR